MAARPGPAGVLLTELGWLGTIRTALALLWRRLTERPFAHLPPAADRRERLSRGQALPAVLLYRALRAAYGPQRALVVAGRVIEAGAVEHLAKTLGDLDPAAFAALSDDARQRRVAGWLDRFFTATATVDEVGPDRVGFTVSACALVRLAHAAGHPELGPTFCTGDALFFATRTPPVALQRAETLAEGGAGCPFRLTLG
jgi:hypothetical protein